MITLQNIDTKEFDTRACVQKAAAELASEGLRVSVRAVRDRVGRGSATTIANELRIWRSQQPAHVERAEDLSSLALPANLAQEAQVLYLRVLAHVGTLFSAPRANDALASAITATQQIAAMAHTERLTNFGIGVADQLLATTEERARLTFELLARDATIEKLSSELAQATGEITRLSNELVTTKLLSAEREAQALTRVEGLNKHLMRMTDEQREQIARPLASLKERYEGLQDRESAFIQQINALREQYAVLKGRLQERNGD